MGSPFEVVGSCDGSDLEPCQTTTNKQLTTVLSQTLTNTQDTQTASKRTVDASGSGWGVHASVSVSQMAKYGASSTSTSFVKNEIFETVELTFQNVNNLKLTEGAKKILSGTDPLSFLDFYGTGFVFNLGKSGSFFGSVYVSATDSSSSDSLNAVATASYDGGIFSVEGSAAFANEMSVHSQNLQKYINAEIAGGANISSSFSTPNDVEVAFDQWHRSINQDPKSNSIYSKMMIQSWVVCDEIVEILAELNNQTVNDLFQTVIPTPNTMGMITREWVLSMNLLNTATNIMSWGCVNAFNATKAAVIQVNQDISTHVTNIETLDGRQILWIQEQMKNGDYTFFKAFYGVFSEDLAKAHDTDECKSQCTCLDDNPRPKGTRGFNGYKMSNGSINHCNYWEMCIMRDSTCHCELPLFELCQCDPGAEDSVFCFWFNVSDKNEVRNVSTGQPTDACPRDLGCSSDRTLLWNSYYWWDNCVGGYLAGNSEARNSFFATPAFIAPVSGGVVLLGCLLSLLIYWRCRAKRKEHTKQLQLAMTSNNNL